jgi:hypothetical protein
MLQQVPEMTFRPSRALPPFAGIFFLLIVFLTFRIFTLAPFIVVLVLLPFVGFALWWFMRLFFFSVRFSVTVSQESIDIQQPSHSLLDLDIVRLSWKEIRDVDFKVDEEFNPRHFTGRNATLTFRLQGGSSFVLEQITTLDQYSDLFTKIQEHIPFMYELPTEQLWDQRLRQVILCGLLIVLIALLIIFFK